MQTEQCCDPGDNKTQCQMQLILAAFASVVFVRVTKHQQNSSVLHLDAVCPSDT